jgi:predicted acylesterase/phospholipase RssA
MCSYRATPNFDSDGIERDYNEINRHYDGESQLEIWQAARATSAAPTFFKPIDIDGISYVDGGLGYNNPAFEVLDEGEDLFDFTIPGNPVGLACLVSIGTGEAATVPAYNLKQSVLQRIVPTHAIEAMISIVTDCESTNERLMRRFRSCPSKYFRFNVDRGLDKVQLDDWKKADYVVNMTKEYLGRRIATAIDIRDKPYIITYST